MLSIAVAVITVAGCDRVFDLELRPAEAGIDMAIPIDAVDAAPAVSSIDPILDIAINEPTLVTAHVAGPLNTAAPYEFTATLGTYDQPTGVELVGVTGEATVTAMYTSTTPGAGTIAVNVLGSTAMTNIDVRARSFEGNDVTMPSTQQWGSLSLFASPIAVTRAGSLRSIGMRTNASVARVRFALYDANRTKVAETGPQLITANRTVVGAPRLMLTPGTYWVAATFDAITTVHATAGGVSDVLDSTGQIFGSSFPVDLSGTTRTTGMRYPMFIEIAYSSGQ